MSNKIWILNSLSKNDQYRDKEKVDNYIKHAIESGQLVKLSYVNKEIQDFFRACVEDELYKGEINPIEVQEYIKDYQTSSKILFVDELGYHERSLKFSKEIDDFVGKSDINTDKDNWIDFGGVNGTQKIEEKSKKTIKEKTDLWGFLIGMLPYMYFMGNYTKKFTSVLTIATLWAVIILVYKLARKKATTLNVGIAGIFLAISAIRVVNPYWVNSIAALFVTLGICIVFLAGEFMGEGILSSYYKTSKRKSSDYHKFTSVWLGVFAIILGNVIYSARVSFGMSIGLMVIVWIITSVALKGGEVPMEEMEEKSNETKEEIIIETVDLQGEDENETINNDIKTEINSLEYEEDNKTYIIEDEEK